MSCILVAAAALPLSTLLPEEIETTRVGMGLPAEVLPPVFEVGGVRIQYERASVSVSSEAITLHLTGVRADSGLNRLEAPTAEAVLSSDALVSGAPDIRRLEIVRPRITVTLPETDGPVRPPDPLVAASRVARTASDLLEAVDLDRLDVTDAEIHILGGGSERWSTRGAALSLWREGDGRRGYARPGPGLPNTTLFYERGPAAAQARIEAELDGLFLQGLPVSGRIALLSRDDGGDRADIALALDAGGLLEVPMLGEEALDVERAAVSARLADGLIEVSGFEATIGGSTVTGAGAWSRALGAFEIDARLDQVTVAEVRKRWPRDLARDARTWFRQHAGRGRIADAHLTSSLGGSPSLTFDFSGVTMDLPQVPRLTRARGRARVTPRRLDIFSGRASVGGLSARNGRVRFLGLGVRPGRLHVKADLAGPTAAAVKLAGEDCPGRLEGRADLHLELTLPFTPSARPRRMALTVTGRARDLALEGAKVLDRFTVRNGQMEIRADRRTIQLDGTASVDGVPMQVRWKKDAATELDQVRVQATLDGAARSRLGVPAIPGLTGPIILDLEASSDPHGPTLARATVDLSPAALEVPVLGFTKPRWARARAQLFARLEADGTLHVKRARIRGGDLDVIGAIRVDPEGEIASAHLSRVRVAGHDFSFRMRRRPELFMKLRGRRLDVRPLLEGLGRSGGDETERATVDLRLKETRVTSELTLKAVSGLIHLDAGGLDDARVAARAGNARLLLRARRRPLGHQVDLQATDAGALAKELGVASSIIGGRGRVLGTLRSVAGRPLLDGRAIIRDYRVSKTPGLAALASTSLEGIIDLIRGKGVHFDETDVRFSLDGHTLHIDEAQASGAALALATHGSIDLVRGRTHLEGRVAPLNDINRVIRRIPLIGKLLVPEGDGLLIAPSYSVEGDLAQPTVKVKAESLLLPAFLRRLFGR